MSIAVLYEDEKLIIINKDSGIPVIPGRGNLSTAVPLVEIVEDYLAKKVYIVHRLDRETSGLILFAKDSSTHRMLNIQFEKKEIRKEYLAAVLGPIQSGGVIDAPIFEFGSGRMGVDKRGKESKTTYEIVTAFNNATLLDVFPQTGRRHQIRVHLYSIGHPILGDTVYGNPRPVGRVERLMLHAHAISFMHPDGVMRSFEAPVDEKWKSIVMSLQGC